MQDRFKFRVWDKINEKWVEKCLLDIESGYLLGYYDNKQAYKRRYAIMQCTGLKDKNGKLIYEGDIVTDDFDKYVIEWEGEPNYQYFAVWLPIETCKTCSTLEQLLSIEVIGNIYENKELLND